MDILLNKLKKHLARLIIILVLMLSVAILPKDNTEVTAAENPQATYTGISDAPAVLKNLSFTDLANSKALIKEAVYETSAVGSIKAYGSNRFGIMDIMTKEEVIYTIYRAVGREGEAQKAGEALNLARTAANRKTDPLSIWYDGALQLAANDKLISSQDLTDALNVNQKSIQAGGFLRNAPAQRQEMGFWLAKLLEKAKVYSPSYGQQKIFNSFNDWQTADAEKIPYLDRLVADNIMNDDGDGNFMPKGMVNKAQAAQILKNAGDVLYPLRLLNKQMGTIESIDPEKGAFLNKNISRNLYKVRNSDGKLYLINAEFTVSSGSVNRVETKGTNLPLTVKDLIVYKNGVIGNSTLLKKGDRIEYITSSADNSVKYVNVLSSINNTNYFGAKIDKIDTVKHTITLIPELRLNYPEISINSILKQYKPDEQGKITYTYSNNLLTLINKQEDDIKNVKNGSEVIITIQNNIVTELRNFDTVTDGEAGVVKGIVEDNNPQLGYITLYSENGNGAYPGTKGQQFLLRTYNFTNKDSISVIKNQENSGLDGIEVGDTVFLKLDDQSNVTSVSAVSNYTVKYGRVLSKKAGTLAIQYDNGTQQILNVDNNLFVVANRKAASYSSIKDGDRIKMLLSITNKFTKLMEVTVEGQEHFISNIYKGDILKFDNMTNTILLQNLQVLKNGQWERTDQKGTTGIKLTSGSNFYFDDKIVNLKNINKYYVGNTAYLAVEKDYGGTENIVLASFRSEEDSEAEPYNDYISNAQAGEGEFSLSKSSNSIKYGNGTIVVKDGRLVSGNSIAPQDMAYVVANRSYGNGDYIAGVVQISDRSGMNFAQTYRGRISGINTNKDVTVDSFSQLSGLNWNFTNTPKTFKLTSKTVIKDDAGVVNQRDFTASGTNGFKDKTVYIIADGVNALFISTAPYGVYNAKGTIDKITGGAYDSDGNVITDPSGFTIRLAKVYDASTHLWVNSNDITLNILKNSVILKDNKVSDPSELKTGDPVRIIKKDNQITGDAYIIIVEN